MSATRKHEFHPDAESLNAFAEQALSERERGQVLEHLAVCSRCRQVVALARDAADAEVVAPSAARRVANQPDSWWKKWRLVWLPTAAVTAFAAVSISVYVYKVDQNTATNKIAEQTTTQNEPMAANPAPPTASSAPAAPPVHAAKSPAPSAPKSSRRQVVAAVAASPPPEALEQVEVTSEERPATPGAAGSGFTSKSLPQAEAPSIYNAPPATLAFREEQKRQDEQKRQEEERRQAQVVESRMLTASASTPGAQPAAGNVPASPDAAASVSNQQIVVRADSLAGFSSMRSARGMSKVSAAEVGITLPSGLPAVSTAASVHRRLAIDKAGALFLSDDGGITWRPVQQQWTGRAVAVRKHTAPDTIDTTAPATASPAEQSEAVPGVSGGAPAPPALFEILNDKNQMWLSTDGRLWIAK
jgi:hypothetical protein